MLFLRLFCIRNPVLPALLISLCALPSAKATDAFSMKRCVNMGNALERPNGASWGGRYYTQEDYERIADAGFDTVRIPIRWSDYTGPAPNYRIHPDFAALAEQNVDAALAVGLNVILNVHHFEEIMEKPVEQQARFLSLWQQIGTMFADAPEQVWFEPLNEPKDQLFGRAMRRTLLSAVAVIRQTNPNRIIILGGEEYSGIRTLGSNALPPDENIVYTVHYYDPFDFTHQQAEWLGDARPKRKRGWGSVKDKKQLRRAVETAVFFRGAVKRPIFVGEFGVHEAVKPRARVKWITAVKEAMEAADIPWCLWSYGNTFALYDDETGWDKQMLEVLIGD